MSWFFCVEQIKANQRAIELMYVPSRRDVFFCSLCLQTEERDIRLHDIITAVVDCTFF